MVESIQQIARKLDEMELKYTLEKRGEHEILKVGMATKAAVAPMFTFLPGGEETDLHIAVIPLTRCLPQKRIELLRVLNDLNCRYRYAKFSMDKDNDVIVRYDVARKNGTAGQTAVEIMLRMRNIIEECYPEIMRTIWA